MAAVGDAGAVPPADEEYRRKLRRLGIDEDSDLYEILTVSHAASMTAEAAARSVEVAVRDGALGMSPETRKQLAADLVSRAERLFDRRASWLALRTALAAVGTAVLVAAGTGAVCWWLGERSGLAQAQEMAGAFRDFLASDPEGAAAVLRLAAYNDFAKAVKGDACRRTRREAGGWVACDLPLWLERAGEPGK